jgi:glycosyltransferase involved in cell wall biosynthesis
MQQRQSVISRSSARAGESPTVDVTVVILTHNEESNVSAAIASVQEWTRQVYVLDSGSTDSTVQIVESLGARVFVHKFTNYSAQRLFAVEQLPIETAWILFLDADEWIPEDLRYEMSEVIASDPPESGYYVRFRLIWSGRELRHGIYSTWILRLFRRGHARCDDRGVNERMEIDGPVGYLKHRFVHEDRKGLTEWIAKHNRYSTAEATILLNAAPTEPGRLLGSPSERKRWLRTKLWPHVPPVFRVFLYFIYRYVFSLGFLDGFSGFTYHFLQGLWYPLLIDLKYLELRNTRK